MGKRLREITEKLPTWTNLLGVESQMVRVPQEFLEQQLSFFQFPSTRQTFDVPKRASCETSLSAGNSVDVGTFGLVTTDKSVFDQSRFNRFHSRTPHGIDRADEPHQWH